MSVPKKDQRRGTILDEILRYHREQLPKLKRQTSLADLRAFASIAAPPRDFYAALAAPGVSLIAECKKASPSKGLLVRDYDPVALARTYARAGARAISVLTDARHFQGALAHLRDIREAGIDVPLLRKDFVFDPYHIFEARAAGADAILLIAAVLGSGQMSELLALTHELGMNALVEVHTSDELAAALPLAPRIIGVNNRDLQTFQVDFANTARLRALIPAGILTVAESGLKTDADVREMVAIGVDAMLVGETLVKSKDVAAAVRQLVAAGKPASTQS